MSKFGRYFLNKVGVFSMKVYTVSCFFGVDVWVFRFGRLFLFFLCVLGVYERRLGSVMGGWRLCVAGLWDCGWLVVEESLL